MKPITNFSFAPDFRAAIDAICDACPVTQRGAYTVEIMGESNEDIDAMAESIIDAMTPEEFDRLAGFGDYCIAGGGEAVIGRIIECYGYDNKAMITLYQSHVIIE